MKRRSFLKRSATALLASGLNPGLMANTHSNLPSDRLAMTTVTFLSRFAQTRPGNGNDESREPHLTLLDIPGYFSRRFQLKNLEFWSRHFESTEDAYLMALRAKIAKYKARLINIQLDGRYDLSNPDVAAREESIALARKWIDVARNVGSAGLRLNPGSLSVDVSIESFRELSRYAANNGIVLYVENHMGFGTNPENILKIHHSVDSDNLKILTDFANFGKEFDQLKGIRMLIPYSGLVSAKAFYFDDSGKHPDYDFDACVRVCEESGYRGIYSAEYYDPEKRPAVPEFIADQILNRIRRISSSKLNLGTGK